MYPQLEFLKYLRFQRSLLACDEVSNYGCIADVLAVDKNKKHILEYEFKNSSQDLKIAEKKKSKYQLQGRVVRKPESKGQKCFWLKEVDEVQQPHRFYFVVPRELYEKEKDYLEAQGCGIIDYVIRETADINRKPIKVMDFLTRKPCRLRKKNLQKYEVAARSLLIRCTSAYVNRLDKEQKQKEWDKLQEVSNVN